MWKKSQTLYAAPSNRSPVQVQKLLFLLDENISEYVDGPHFNFEPYDYGPFDQGVYTVIDGLVVEGLIDTQPEPSGRWSIYQLTDQGQQEGERLLGALPKEIAAYVEEISNFVRSLSFAQLVSAIYKAYPHMKANSVFRG